MHADLADDFEREMNDVITDRMDHMGDQVAPVSKDQAPAAATTTAANEYYDDDYFDSDEEGAGHVPDGGRMHVCMADIIIAVDDTMIVHVIT